MLFAVGVERGWASCLCPTALGVLTVLWAPLRDGTKIQPGLGLALGAHPEVVFAGFVVLRPVAEGSWVLGRGSFRLGSSEDLGTGVLV